MNLENALVSQLLTLMGNGQQKNDATSSAETMAQSSPALRQNQSQQQKQANLTIPFLSQIQGMGSTQNVVPGVDKTQAAAQQFFMQQMILQQLAGSTQQTNPMTQQNLMNKLMGINNPISTPSLWPNPLQTKQPSVSIAQPQIQQPSNTELNLLLSLMGMSQKPQTPPPQPTANEQTLQLQQQLQLMQQNQLMQQLLLSQASSLPSAGLNNPNAMNEQLLLASLMGLGGLGYANAASPASSSSSNQCLSEKSTSKSTRTTKKDNNQRVDSPSGVPSPLDRHTRKRKNSANNQETLSSEKSSQEDAKRCKNSATDYLYQMPLKMGWKRETIVKGVGPAGIFGDVSYVTPCGKRLWKIETVFEHLNSLTETNPDSPNQLTVKAFNFRSTYRLGSYFEYNADTNQSLTEIPDEKVDKLLENEITNQNKNSSTSANNNNTPDLNNRYTAPNTNESNGTAKEEEILKNLTNPEKIPEITVELTKFFHHLIDEQKKFEENYEKEKEIYIKNEREKLFQSCIEHGISIELKRQVDDLRLLNTMELPNFDEIKGFKMSPKVFSDCLMVLEFLHAFNETFAIEKDSIPSIITLQAAFVDRDPRALDAVVHLVIELLRFACVDPGIPNSKLYTTTTGRRFSEIEVDLETYSGILRAFIIGRNGYETQMSDWLDDSPPTSEDPQEMEVTESEPISDHEANPDDNENLDEDDNNISLPTKSYRSLDGEKQAAILCFLIDELVCDGKSVQVEIDKTMEHNLTLKRDKWTIESKIRKLKMILNRKCLGPTLLSINETNDAARLDTGEKEKVLMEFGWDVRKPTLTQNTVQLSELEVELPPSDDEESVDLGVLETRIKKLQTMAEAKQKLIDECQFKLWGCFLGQDRYKRNYHVFGSLGGLYVEGPKKHREADFGSNDEAIVKEIIRRREMAKKRDMKNLLSTKLSKRYIPTKEDYPEESEDEVLESPKTPEPVKAEEEKEPLKTDSSALDLSVEKAEEPTKVEEKPVSPKPVKNEGNRESPSELSVERQQELCEKYGLDDTILTTAALLYITQNNIAETSGSLWQTLALEYKKILTKLIADEIQVLNGRDDLGKGSLSECLLHLSDWLKKNKDPKSSKFDVDHETLLGELSMKEVEENVTKSLVKLNIQSEKFLPIPKMHFNNWRVVNQSGEQMVTEYMRVCAQRGFRERNLSKNMRKNEELIISTMRVRGLEIPEDLDDVEHNWIKVRSRRGKGRGKIKEVLAKIESKSNGRDTKMSETKEAATKSRKTSAKNLPLAKRLALLTGNDAHLNDPDYIDECDLIEEIENLEDRVLSSSLQKKGWQASVRIIDDDTVYLISSKSERKSKMDQYPLDMAKSKLLQLQENIETRYLVSQSLASCEEVDMNDWIKKMNGATKAAQIRTLLKDLSSMLAWHKSIMKVLCQICFKDNNEAALLLCDGCDQGFHMYCFRPVLESIPDGSWFCYDCQCKKSKEEMKLCFICGNEEGGQIKNARAENFKSTQASRRLTTCDQCQRCVHPECLRPPQTKLPKKWLCTACTHSKPNTDRKKASVQTPQPTPVKEPHNSQTPTGQESDKQSLSSNSSQQKKINGTLRTRGTQNKTATNNNGSSSKSKRNKLERKEEESNSPHETEEEEPVNPRVRLPKEQPLWPENPEEFELMSDEILEYCRLSTIKMVDHDTSWPFRVPVNTKEIPMYRKVIKKPMDFSYVSKKCNANSRISYRKFKNWVDDVRLIFRNCEIFNEDDSEIGKSGHIMSVFFERQILDPAILKPMFERSIESSDESDEDDAEEEAVDPSEDKSQQNSAKNGAEIPNITENSYSPQESEDKKKTPSPPNLQKPSPISDGS